jgi:oxygen-dependent protoporphyrinogen oxidase
VIIVGGGIAGLSCAWRLRAAGIPVEVLEAERHPGGNVRSEELDGFLLERGPHTFMRSADDIFALALEVGLEDQLIASRPAAKKRFIVRDGRLHKVFTGPGSFLTSRLLSFRGKWKLLGEPFRTKQRGDPGDTAAEFFERRFGPEAAQVLAGAFISGVYAGDPKNLSAPAAFPLFWRFEQESGSMIRGAMRQRKQQKAQGNSRARRPKGLFSFQRGLGQLSDAVAGKLGRHCRIDTPVREIHREGKEYMLRTDDGLHRAQRLVLAVPPQVACRLLQGVNPILADLLGLVPMSPIAVVYMGHRDKAAEVPDGFGFLAPRDEGIRTLGVLFPSRLFEGRAPNGGDLFTGFVGGALDPEAVNLDDEELLSIVSEDLERLTGFSRRPTFVKVERHLQAIPQFTLGHLERMTMIRSQLKELPGLFLAGNYLRGVGMKDAVGSGFEVAAAIGGRRRKEAV